MANVFWYHLACENRKKAISLKTKGSMGNAIGRQGGQGPRELHKFFSCIYECSINERVTKSVRLELLMITLVLFYS